VELAPARTKLLEAWGPALGRLGFVVEPFGAGRFLLREVPSLLRHEDPHRLLDDLAGELAPSGDRPTSPGIDRILSFVACRAAIKAHHPLEREEMAQLLRDLAATVTPFFCPHGRPIVSRISLREIKRDLRRE
jgi:DNA mismatch repair protein MutL